ncbi:hypothetical protein SAMN05216524_11512 [Mucilaginibacter sp. OK098]|nr:hypothetical protein SAMN05216524_11512 [Mucilaginibacter sp. OK098]
MLSSYFFYRCPVTDGMEGERPESAGNVTLISPIQGKPAAAAIQLTDPEKNHIKRQQVLPR